MQAVEIKPDIYWVGGIDWTVRDFHGYITPNGTSYNNYLIMDEQVTLVDAVKSDLSRTCLDRISSVVDPGKIKNIVVNHIEMDHGAVDKILAVAPNATLYMTKLAKAGLARHFDISGWNINIVKSGDELSIGKKTLLFLETPMLHWPDSMVTYVKEDKLLLSQDAFGQHYASSSRFDDGVPVEELEDAVVDYYANILMPFGKLITSKLAEIEKLGLEIDMIAPDHGVIWRKDPSKVLKMYHDMASGKAECSAVIIYDTMWKSTELMTRPLMEGLLAEGVPTKVVKLRNTPMSIAIKEFWKSRGMLVGTPTLNNLMFPSVAEFLTHLRGLRPTNRIACAFGSYGWGGGAVREAYGELNRMKLETFEPGIAIKYRPDQEDMKNIYDFGRQFGRNLKEYHKQFEDIESNV